MKDKPALLNRLRRIEGQIRGLQSMVEEERDCSEILTQIASASQALESTGKLMLKNHLRTCVSGALRAGDTPKAERQIDEIVNLFGRHWK